MNWLRSSLSSVGRGFAGLARNAAHGLSLVAPYLANLLWLITANFRELTEQGFKGNAAVYACINLLATSVPEPPLIAYSRDADGEPDQKLDYRHPLRQLIRQPNSLMTEFEFWELTVIHLCIVGRSVWWKERDQTGRIISLWPLRPDRIGPIYAGPADTEPVIRGWSYLVPGTVEYIPLANTDVMVFNLPDPLGDSGGIVEGVGPMQVLAAEVGADNAATQFVGSMVSNYGQPGFVLQVQAPIASEDDARRIKEGFMRDFGGVRRGQPALVDAGTQIQQVGFTLQQLEFPNLRKISESRIASAFRVPPILVGLLVGLEAGIKATTDELRAFFTETTLASYWRRLSDQYTNDIGREFDEGIICRFDLRKVQASASAELARVRDAYERGAVLKNEYRDALGLPEVPGGDVFEYGIAPGKGAETDAPPGSNPLAPQNQPDAQPSQPAADQQRAPKPAAGKSADLVSEPLEDQGREQILSAFDDLMASLEPVGAAHER